MNMNKTLLAVALATAGLSANVMALTFTDGNFNGSVDIGGTITVPVATNQWQWAAGTGLNAYTHAVTVMTNNYKTLTIPVAADTALLVGQTKAATVGAVGGVGITPRISFMQADGTTPAVITYNGTADGKGVMSLQVVNSTTPTAVLGSAVVNVKAAGVGYSQTSSGDTWNGSVAAAGPVTLFQTASNPTPRVAADALTPNPAIAWTEALGLKGRALMIADMVALSGISAGVDHLGAAGDFGFSAPAEIFSGSYGLGIAAGDKIVVNFTNPVAAETNWKAPLNIAVTYL